MKATSSYIGSGDAVRIPVGCTNCSQEVELGVVIGRRMQHVQEKDVMDHVGECVWCSQITPQPATASRWT